MSLTTPEEVRRKTGIEATDEELNPYIKDASYEWLNDVAIYVRDDTLTGEIDGVNSTFFLTHPYVADRNCDKIVNSLDVEVYKWGTSGSLDTRSTINISSFDPYYGRIVLSSIPESTCDLITATYYYYKNEISTVRIKDAVAYLAGFYYVMKEYLLIPERLSHGAYRFSFAKPWMNLLDQYYRTRDQILSTPVHKGEHDVIQASREAI